MPAGALAFGASLLVTLMIVFWLEGLGASLQLVTDLGIMCKGVEYLLLLLDTRKTLLIAENFRGD
jgi:hypothetical protein